MAPRPRRGDDRGEGRRAAAHGRTLAGVSQNDTLSSQYDWGRARVEGERKASTIKASSRG